MAEEEEEMRSMSCDVWSKRLSHMDMDDSGKWLSLKRSTDT